jgi:hypothetical protein
MSVKGDQHVVPYGNQWAVKGSGNSRVTSVHNTQQEAIDAGRGIAHNQGGELFIHGRNGRIRHRDSSGLARDPYPPPG